MSDVTYRYLGIRYSAASKEAAQLIKKAHQTGDWYALPEKLIALRSTMQRQIEPLKELVNGR